MWGNFHGFPTTAYFSVLIMSRKILSGKTFAVSENCNGFLPQMFYHIWLNIIECYKTLNDPVHLTLIFIPHFPSH